MPIILRNNPYMAADAYKQRHWDLYPDGYDGAEAYAEPRVGRKLDRVRFFGLQAYLKQYHVNATWTKGDEAEAEALLTPHGAPLSSKLKEAIDIYGRLPISVDALPEGLVVPAGTPLYRINHEDDRFANSVNWVETQFLRGGGWYPTTTCTGSYEMKEDARRAYERSGADIASLAYHLHDFGGRGVSGMEQAMIGGASHLVNFRGTDTDEALLWIKEYYHSTGVSETVIAYEHNVVLTWIAKYGREHGEDRLIEHICDNLADKFVSVVADTTDQDAFFDKICGKYRERIQTAFTNGGGKFIPRPDSGEPTDNVVKYGRQLLNGFGDVSKNRFGKTPNFMGSIQGDGIDRIVHKECLEVLHDASIRADQWFYGSGGGLLMKHTRDDAGFAQKQARARIDGVWYPTPKVPKSDPTKATKGGNLAVTRDDDGTIITVQVEDLNGRENLLRRTYHHAQGLLIDEDFETIRNRENAQ